MSCRPEDFYGETPAPRVIGTECEYDLQMTNDETRVTPGQILTPTHLRDAKIPNHNGYLGSAYGMGRVYADVGHMELATREAFGPAAAAVEDIAGIDRIAEILHKSGAAHSGLFRLAATCIPYPLSSKELPARFWTYNHSSGVTKGYHENYLLPYQTARSRRVGSVVSAMVASRIWANSGMVHRDGFVLGQKIWGIGFLPSTLQNMEPRTLDGSKPMMVIPPQAADQDTIGDDDWARLEVRAADPGLSLVNRYAAFAAISLALRLVEHEDFFDEHEWDDLGFSDPVGAAKTFAHDRTLTETSRTQWGQNYSALDMQERFVEMFDILDKRVQLPHDEHVAIDVIKDMITALRRSSPEHGQYDPMARMRINFAAQHQFVLRGKDLQDGNVLSEDAVARSLAWDRIVPTGYGRKFWYKIENEGYDSVVEDVRAMAAQAPIPDRALRRAAIIDDESNDGIEEVKSWAMYKAPESPLGKTKVAISLGSPAD